MIRDAKRFQRLAAARLTPTCFSRLRTGQTELESQRPTKNLRTISNYKKTKFQSNIKEGTSTNSKNPLLTHTGVNFTTEGSEISLKINLFSIMAIARGCAGLVWIWHKRRKQTECSIFLDQNSPSQGNQSGSHHI